MRPTCPPLPLPLPQRKDGLSREDLDALIEELHQYRTFH